MVAQRTSSSSSLPAFQSVNSFSALADEEFRHPLNGAEAPKQSTEASENDTKFIRRRESMTGKILNAVDQKVSQVLSAATSVGSRHKRKQSRSRSKKHSGSGIADLALSPSSANSLDSMTDAKATQPLFPGSDEHDDEKKLLSSEKVVVSADKVQMSKETAVQRATANDEETLLEEAPFFVLITTYVGYLILIVFGHIRDFFGKRFKRRQYAHLKNAKVV